MTRKKDDGSYKIHADITAAVAANPDAVNALLCFLTNDDSGDFVDSALADLRQELTELSDLFSASQSFDFDVAYRLGFRIDAIRAVASAIDSAKVRT